jgi:hypothetical protein
MEPATELLFSASLSGVHLGSACGCDPLNHLTHVPPAPSHSLRLILTLTMFVRKCKGKQWGKIGNCKALGGLKKGEPVSNRLLRTCLPCSSPNLHLQDLLIFEPSSEGAYHGLAVEFKLPGQPPRADQVRQ